MADAPDFEVIECPHPKGTGQARFSTVAGARDYLALLDDRHKVGIDYTAVVSALSRAENVGRSADFEALRRALKFFINKLPT
jgi:hypothetical protein